MEAPRRDAGLRRRLLAAALLVAGCGGAEPLSKQEYEREFRKAGAGATPGPPPARKPAPRSRQAAVFERSAVRLREIARRLDSLDPPEEVADAHDDYVAGLREMADVTRRWATAIRAGDPRRADAVIAESVAKDRSPPLAPALREFRRRGYWVGASAAP